MKDREAIFQASEEKLKFPIQVYRLGETFKDLGPELAAITMLDVTAGPGCHYGVKNIFVPIIHHLEAKRSSGRGSKVVISPETAILIEPSTGNGWVAFSDAAEELGYEHAVIMPDGLPERRYQHPDGRKVEIIKTPKEDYAQGMPRQLEAMLKSNSGRIRRGEKIYVSPNHANASADITVKAMSEIGRQLMEKIGQSDSPVRLVLSMGNGASLCAVGEFVKGHSAGGKVVATESLAYGGGYDRFNRAIGGESYPELFGIDPGHPSLMARFSTFGTNAPIGIEMPLQERAMGGGLVDDYLLFTDNAVLEAYKDLQLNTDFLSNALDLPNLSTLPPILFQTFGNSTLANIAVAIRFANRGERVVAMAYDGRQNY